jgi:peptidoglycan/xylan/chitin deacetylase (PgdA/CDA1 family)
VRTLLICHDDADLDSEGLARWLASFSDLTGIVVIHEKKEQFWRRIRREIRRVGILRFLDVVAFRIYYHLVLSRKDREWERLRLQELYRTYPALPKGTLILTTHSPNAPEAEKFIKRLLPDLMIARCKFILKESVFSIPRKGTLVMHPGICPEYRNSHGCFWALARRDLAKVGMTLLRINKGVDTGPVFGYFTYAYDEMKESHFVIQQRVVLENLDKIKTKLLEIDRGEAASLDTSGRRSDLWGQPWLTSYVSWKWHASRAGRIRATSLLYHDVIEGNQFGTSGFSIPGANRYKIIVSDFKEHLFFISRAVFQKPAVVTDFVEVKAPPRLDRRAPPFFLTFDDGGTSATIIADLLDEYGWKAHFLITASLIGTQGFLNAGQIRLLRARGHVIGSHSWSHPTRMSACSSKRLKGEWVQSVQLLSDILGEEVEVASVPGGYYSKRVAKAAAEAGIKALFTSEPERTCRHVCGCLVLGRYGIRQGMSPANVAGLASGHISPRLRQFLSWNLKKIPKTVGGNAWLRMRDRLTEEA